MFNLRRLPDKILFRETPENPYLRRWHVLPRNKYFNIYLHEILMPDAETALHDHPWWNISIVLKGGYLEYLKGKDGDLVKQIVVWRSPGSIIFRRATDAHRIGLAANWDPAIGKQTWLPSWSLFITGRNVRVWGFHCPQGWTPYDKFLKVTSTTSTGKGCES